MTDSMASLYSHEYRLKGITNSEEENDEINFIIEHKDEGEVHGELVKSKTMRKKLPIIFETSSETWDNKICSKHSDVVKAKKKKSHIILHTLSESSDEGTLQKEL